MKCEYRQLGTLVKRKIGYGIVQPGPNQKQGIPIIKVNNIISGLKSITDLDCTTEQISSKYERTKLHGGELIISVVGTIGKTAIVPKAFAGCNLVRATAMIDIPDLQLAKWVKYYLDSPKGQAYIHQNLNTTVQPTLNIKSLSEIPIPFYSDTQMQQVVSVLESFDNKIELNNKINENLQQQVRAILSKWLLENEENYEFASLSDVAVINPDTYSPKEGWEYVNYLDTSSITDGVISEVQYIEPSTEKLPSRARRIIAKNDVVFSTVRPNQRHFGIIREPLENMLASTGFAVVRSKYSYVSNELLYLCLTENSFIEKVQQLAEQSTSTFPSIKPSDLGTCEIPCPIDQHLSETLNSIFAYIASNQRENNSLAILRETLLPRLMSGDLDVSNIKI